MVKGYGTDVSDSTFSLQANDYKGHGLDLRGMKVALVEMNDFAEGTSSRSSKLIHGGIRYLENQEFKLVFEALSERAKLFEMAPHLAIH